VLGRKSIPRTIGALWKGLAFRSLGTRKGPLIESVKRRDLASRKRMSRKSRGGTSEEHCTRNRLRVVSEWRGNRMRWLRGWLASQFWQIRTWVVRRERSPGLGCKRGRERWRIIERLARKTERSGIINLPGSCSDDGYRREAWIGGVVSI
jgi:hypothetical protein